MAEESEGMTVTPWKVEGEVDYERLMEQFGTEPITETLLERIKKHTGDLHLQLRRRVFFSHRDLDWILDMYEAGREFVLYTGRGPSGPVHIGHLVPWFFTKYLQDKFDAKLFFQMTDDEKFLIHPEFTLQKVKDLTYDNALDIISVGFTREKTFIISDVDHIKFLYELAIEVAKHVNFTTVKAVFGFEDSSNIGIIFFPALQAVPCFIESRVRGENVPCLIPAAIDQDPYWRMTRDVAPKIGYYKPAQIHCKFMPGLGKGGKMSASMPETCIFTTDPPEVAERKVWNAFTGGKPTIKEQKLEGGNPLVCTVFQYLNLFFEEDDKAVKQLEVECRSGGVMCGECKERLAERVKKFLSEHQRRREKARDVVDEFFIGDRINLNL